MVSVAGYSLTTQARGTRRLAVCPGTVGASKGTYPELRFSCVVPALEVRRVDKGRLWALEEAAWVRW